MEKSSETYRRNLEEAVKEIEREAPLTKTASENLQKLKKELDSFKEKR